MLSIYPDKACKNRTEAGEYPLWNNFLDPGIDYGVCPFWFWNGDLNPDELVRQIHLMHSKGVDGFMIHARKGLQVAYLSPDWFDRCRISIEMAHELGMNVWIYDDFNWPSGYAGGRVCDGNPEFRAQNLKIERHLIEANELLELQITSDVMHITSLDVLEKHKLPPNPDVLFPAHNGLGGGLNSQEFKLVFGSIQEIDWRNKTKLALKFPVRRLVCVFKQQPTQWWGVYSKHYYSDLLNCAAVDKFIKETHEQYYLRFKKFFGKTIKGFFVDEPGFYNNFWDRNVGSIPWTTGFSQEFRERRGYDLLMSLPHIWETIDDSSISVRHDYYKTVAELFEDRFFNKLSTWCSDHNVSLTGHLEMEEYLLTNTRQTGSPFNGLRKMHMPGVDRIDSVWEKISEKLVSSIAHAYGQKRVLSESFALCGWRLDPAMMKQIIDRQYVRGINFLNPHAFYYSIEGDLKKECPPSEFFQNPWWDHSEQLWNYVKRLSCVLSQGEHYAPIALYYPISSYWTQITPQEPSASGSEVVAPSQMQELNHPAQQIDRRLIELSQYLLNHQWDYDFIDDSLLREKASICEKDLVINKEHFQVLIIPEIPILYGEIAEQILKFVSEGLRLIICGGAWPKLCCESDSDLIKKWSAARPVKAGKFGYACTDYGKGKIWQISEGFGPISDLLHSTCKADIKFDGVCDSITYMRRSSGNQNIYFLVNESDKDVEISAKLLGTGNLQQWFAEYGSRSGMLATNQNGYFHTMLHFEPFESKLLVTSFDDVPRKFMSDMKTPQIKWRLNIAEREYEFENLVSWNRLGLAYYSGQGTYHTEINIEQVENCRIILDLGQLSSTAQVCVNGVDCGARCFKPFQFDITQSVTKGINQIAIKVANTSANNFEHLELESGLIGPVAVLFEKNELNGEVKC